MNDNKYFYLFQSQVMNYQTEAIQYWWWMASVFTRRGQADQRQDGSAVIGNASVVRPTSRHSIEELLRNVMVIIIPN